MRAQVPEHAFEGRRIGHHREALDAMLELRHALRWRPLGKGFEHRPDVAKGTRQTARIRNIAGAAQDGAAESITSAPVRDRRKEKASRGEWRHLEGAVARIADGLVGGPVREGEKGDLATFRLTDRSEKLGLTPEGKREECAHVRISSVTSTAPIPWMRSETRASRPRSSRLESIPQPAHFTL